MLIFLRWWQFALMILLGIPFSLCAQWEPVKATETKASLRGIHNAGGGVIWASGSGGAIVLSVNNGSSWRQCSVPMNAEKLDFRGVWGFSKDRAIVMSSGPGRASRLYETTNGCQSWRVLFENPDPDGFWDSISFYHETGILLGDPVAGRFVIYRTSDSGQHWNQDKSLALTADPKGEGAFAASNSALVIRPDGKQILFGTGGPGGSRVFMSSSKRGKKWTIIRMPRMGSGDSAGIFSLAFRDRKHGVAVGGDYKKPESRDSTAAFSSDGGASWHSAITPPSGYRSSVEWDQGKKVWITVGPNGSDASTDDGQTWHRFDTAGWNALSAPWAVGADGRIARLVKDVPKH